MTKAAMTPLRRHVGVLVPWANLAMEAELPHLIPSDISWHFSRLVPRSRATAINDTFLQDMIDAVPDALLQFDPINLDLVAFGCTSACFSFPKRLTGSLHFINSQTPCITAFTAIQSTLAHHKAQRILLLAPYEDHVTQKEVSALEESGVFVIESVSMGHADGIGEIGIEEVMDHFARFSTCDADAIVISCTALHTREVIDILKEGNKIPIISSNSAIAATAERILTSFD